MALKELDRGTVMIRDFSFGVRIRKYPIVACEERVKIHERHPPHNPLIFSPLPRHPAEVAFPEAFRIDGRVVGRESFRVSIPQIPVKQRFRALPVQRPVNQFPREPRGLLVFVHCCPHFIVEA